MNIENKLEILTIYRNYIFSLQERMEYGDIYGDTDDLIKIYEKKLKDIIKNDTFKSFTNSR